ncbi:hypothetical protein NQ317_010467 [Molorchus minor]|uniref:Uncharacterized protein n=1 Tax=Molorchus minor TaxID=1323400 RepID=A0ABQ9JZ42_9CUCU|nr:hypothetical protein NQ317_010467 [Molorchus minor]
MELENKARSHESAIHALKDKMSYFKSKSNETDRLREEVTKLKNKIKDMESIEMAINGTRDEVNNVLRTERNVESLALMSAILKKSLVDAERRKREIDHNFKRAQNEATKYRKDCTILESQNSDLKKELQHLKINYQDEKQYLKNKILELDRKISSMDNINITNSSLNRIISESPINLNRRPRLTAPDNNLEENPSPSMAEKVKQIVDSDSPYLPVKSSNIAIDYNSILNTKFQSKSASTKTGFTIFKSPPASLENIKLSNNTGAVYNGLGSTSKEDIFPSPKPAPSGLKRPKTSSSISSSKFRKLAPAASKSKVTNYFSQGSSQ